MKIPGLAALLNLIPFPVPGILGYIYVGKADKALKVTILALSGIIVGAIGAGLVFLGALIALGGGGDDSLWPGITVLAAASLFVFVTWLWSAWDAYRLAKKHNAAIGKNPPSYSTSPLNHKLAVKVGSLVVVVSRGLAIKVGALAIFLIGAVFAVIALTSS